MRLPSWFATGVELGATAGFEVVAFQRGAPWSSDGRVGVCAVTESVDREIGEGAELSIGIGVAADLEHDVVNYLQKSGARGREAHLARARDRTEQCGDRR